MLLKKTNPDWQPSENPGLQLGQTIEFGAPYENLVRTGMAILVDEGGNELELPNQPLQCPICFSVIHGLLNFTTHVSEEHAPKKTELKSEAVTEAPKTEAESLVSEVKSELDKQTAEDLKAKRLAAMAEGRARAKAAKEAVKQEA